MSTLMMNMFQQLNPTNTDVLAELTQIMVKNYFNFTSNNSQDMQILLAITNNYLLLSSNLQGQELNYYCPLSFDLKFQILRKQWIDQKTPGIPYGIRFQKGINNDSCQFYHNNPAIVQNWNIILSKKINQRNFHKLFKAKKKIGKGAFATVYLAQRLYDKKMVAVKAFSKEKQFSGDKGKQSLQNQIKIMRNIEHPNITRLQQVYQTDNSIYVILQYMQGKQLNQQIKNGHKFTQNQCLIIIKQILMGLEHLASRRIIHRDLKPQNIMFKQQGSLELGICDFGLATHADQNKYLFVRCGTPGFVAPQIINIKDMNTKSQPISDIFSAGVIFHQLLLGHSIFPGKKYNDVLAQNRSCQFNFNKLQYQSLSQSTLYLLVSMLDKNPKTRINAQQALNTDYFKSYINNMNNDNMAMDIEENNTINLGSNKKKVPLGQINFNQVQTLKNNSNVQCQKMIDQNQKKISQNTQNTQNIGQSIKKKLSFMANSSGYRISQRKDA